MTGNETGGATGTLRLAAAPIGRADDASPRLRAALADAQIIAAEDTRRLRRLAADLGVETRARVVSYYDQNERARAAELLAELLAGRDVLVVTDAGLPGVSDPGYRLVRAAVAEGVPVTVLPGPSAVTTALVVSGLPTDRFCFEGFAPRRPGERARRLAALAAEPRTMVFFEAPHRLAATLEAMAEAFGADRPAAVCRELTKTFEEVRRGTLGELAAWAADGVRGEITLVVGGTPEPDGTADPADLAAEVAAREAAGTPRKQAIGEVAKAAGVPRREVYDAVVAAKRHGAP
ncbi:ribosomal RNA small subunit methyltransferase I [Actinomadura sp. NBRC 104425]|uniref:16S rRNA (cytidine(1402)-2'-O)-methyltransferase n=1 Tax=Actinomadura sp. NBRC 104425 TaxID=3032204 RepID=UPI0024A16A74|nr:16S rRNA (cytidine(1402)-2'-O)-methyltransferase [Actinomadura sp. NBRC 104425]GLZ10120.1 ribosomal RNA small subunit methyltransferase I [Actinomadura sp. NBRC 104425]